MDAKHDFRLRLKAIRLHLRGVPLKVILNQVHRSRAWFSKWHKRFDQQGTAGLRTQSRRPQHSPTAYSPRMVQLIARTRRRLLKQKVGLIGPGAIQRELRKLKLGKRTPSLSTIRRVLHRQRLIAPATQTTLAYFPKPLTVMSETLQALDWTCRYLEAGTKVYAFHSLNLRTRACFQTIAADKSSETVIAHALASWKTLGIPSFLQLDNDAAFCGGYKAPRVLGRFVRLCLYVGIELIFLPVAEPECNAEVEEFNGLWAQAFWKRQRFATLARVERTSPVFVQWYMTDYAPPVLAGLTPTQAQRTEIKRRLTATQMAHLPATWPITAGRVHFIRKVKADGTISVLNETWKVRKRLAGKYVWATLITHRRQLDIWYQRSAQYEWRLLKTYAYDIPETVARLKAEFAHP